MRSIAWVLCVVASLGVAGYAIVAYTAFPVGSTVHPQMRATYEVHRAGILVHIFASALALSLGPWQFVPAIRRRWPNAHRRIGRAYLMLGVLPGGLAALYMAMHAFGGIVSHIGFGLLAMIWVYTGMRGYQSARARDFVAHRAWMIRNFALTFAAVTLRIQLGASPISGLRFEMFYPILAWSSWVPNLIVAEWLVRMRKRKPQTSDLQQAASTPAC